MAGIVQTLILAPKTPPFPLRHRRPRPFRSPLSRWTLHLPRNRSVYTSSLRIQARARALPDEPGESKPDVPVSGERLPWVKPLSNFVSDNFLPLGKRFKLALKAFLVKLVDRIDSFSRYVLLSVLVSLDRIIPKEVGTILITALAVQVSCCGEGFCFGISLIGGVVLGLANPNLGCLADKLYLSKFSTFAIFIISGLTLRNGEIGDAIKAWPVGLFGLFSILLVTPCFSKILLQIQLQPQEFVTGLALFTCMPTTLSSGVALTQLAGGNTALALAMTVISNLLGILIVPFSISRFIATGVGVSVPTEQLFKSLVLMLLIPLIMGKVLRESFKGLEDLVDQNRKHVSKVSAIFLSLVPWIQVSRSRTLLLMVNPKVFLIAIGLGALLHLVLLVFNALVLKVASASSGGSQSIFSEKENVYAYIIVTSQKTLPVLVAVVEQLGGAFGESGLLVLPCVAAHLIQIIMDSFLVNFFLRKDQDPKLA